MRSFAFRALAHDAKKTIKGKFEPSRQAEAQFHKALKRVAQLSGHIVEAHLNGTEIKDAEKMQQQLNDYAKALGPWAERQAAKLLEQVKNSNARAYKNKSKAIGVALKENLAANNVDAVARKLLNEQVELIKSIPIEAGLRAQKLALEAALEGRRAMPDETTIQQIQEQLGVTTEVAVNRAQLIARTETARATAAINQARAMSVGSNQYRWHNSGDAAVRESHKYYKGKRLQGMIFSWDNPPTLDDGMTGHPGTFPNCRCFAEPVFDTE